MKYWNGEGQYQDLFDKHFKNLVPEIGRADTAEGNALTSNCSKSTHDIFNNGAGNIVNQYEEMDDDDDGEWYYTGTKSTDGGRSYFDDIEDYSGLECRQAQDARLSST
jgi:hypothetical protein